MAPALELAIIDWRILIWRLVGWSAKLPNLIPRQIFRLYSMFVNTFVCCKVTCTCFKITFSVIFSCFFYLHWDHLIFGCFYIPWKYLCMHSLSSLSQQVSSSSLFFSLLFLLLLCCSPAEGLLHSTSFHLPIAEGDVPLLAVGLDSLASTISQAYGLPAEDSPLLVSSLLADEISSKDAQVSHLIVYVCVHVHMVCVYVCANVVLLRNWNVLFFYYRRIYILCCLELSLVSYTFKCLVSFSLRGFRVRWCNRRWISDKRRVWGCGTNNSATLWKEKRKLRNRSRNIPVYKRGAFLYNGNNIPLLTLYTSRLFLHG